MCASYFRRGKTAKTNIIALVRASGAYSNNHRTEELGPKVRADYIVRRDNTRYGITAPTQGAQSNKEETFDLEKQYKVESAIRFHMLDNTHKHTHKLLGSVHHQRCHAKSMNYTSPQGGAFDQLIGSAFLCSRINESTTFLFASDTSRAVFLV